MKWCGLIALRFGAALTSCRRTTPPPAWIVPRISRSPRMDASSSPNAPGACASSATAGRRVAAARGMKRERAARGLPSTSLRPGKTPGLHQWEGLQVLGSDARCRGLAARRPAASFCTPEAEPGASARSWPRPDQHLLPQRLHGRRQVESDKPGQDREPRLHRQRKETRLALDDVETVRTQEVADAAV